MVKNQVPTALDFQCGCATRLCIVLWQGWDRVGCGCSAVTLPAPRMASTAGKGTCVRGKKRTNKQVREAMVGTEDVTLQKTPQVTSRNELSLFIIK